MPFLRRPSLALGLVSLAVTLLVACGDSDGDTTSSSSTGDTTSSSSGGGEGGATTSSSSTGGGEGGAGGGGGGEGGGSNPMTGVPGADLVNAGTTMSSPSYKLQLTVGQSSPAQGSHTSPGYQLRGGIVGATN